MSPVIELPVLPAVVVGSVSHVRHVPSVHSFRHRHYQWLVDLDDLPALRWPLGAVSRFSAADHLDGGRLGGGIRGDLTRFLAGHGIDVADDDRVLMLAQARVLGHVFDPLSVFWVRSAAGRVRAVVLEVHNTYGERHAYLLPDQTDAAEESSVDKAFYVSPFNDVSGRYRVRLVLTAGLVGVSVALDRDDERVLTAVTTGVPHPATAGTVARLAVRHSFMPQRVSLLIRWHGIGLWLRRLTVHTRPSHTPETVR